MKHLVLLLFILSACSGGYVKEGSSPELTSAFVRGDEEVARIKIADYTSAPLRITTMAQLNLPLSETFDLMAHRIPEWFSDIQDVEFYKDGELVDTDNLAAPAVRTSLFKGDKLVENITIYIPKRSIGYQTDKALSEASIPIENHLGLMLFEADGVGGSLVTWMQYYDKSASIFYPVITPAYRYGMESALKGLIEEHGGRMIEPEEHGDS